MRRLFVCFFRISHLPRNGIRTGISCEMNMRLQSDFLASHSQKKQDIGMAIFICIFLWNAFSVYPIALTIFGKILELPTA